MCEVYSYSHIADKIADFYKTLMNLILMSIYLIHIIDICNPYKREKKSERIFNVFAINSKMNSQYSFLCL